MGTHWEQMQAGDMMVTADSRPAGAADIARGVLRLMGSRGFEGLTELTLANSRRADVFALGPKGEISIIEVKSSIADFRSDQKWPEYMPYCDYFYFAVGHDFPQDLIPDEAGLIVADGFGGAILRDAPHDPVAAARRKALTLRFGRLAASRLLSAHTAISLDTARRSA